MSQPDFTPYRPGSGSEGMMFMSRFCDICRHDDGITPYGEGGTTCEILPLVMCYDLSNDEYPGHAWCYLGGEPTCLFFSEGEPGTPEPPPVDPNQLDLFLPLPVVPA